jgi:xanthine dehydrogenase accessory factor
VAEKAGQLMIRRQLIKRVQQLGDERVPFVLATVVRARRPTSVRAGDSAVVLGDGTIEGFVGGDCATSSVRLHSRKALETGEPVLLRLVPGDSEDTLRGDAVHGTVIVERNPCLSGGALEIFLEPQLPAPRIVVIGDAPIARALAEIAGAAGYDVAASDAEQAQPGPGDTAVVVASHGSGEEAVLAQALSAGVPYVALVASRARGAAVRAALDVPDELRRQLHTPAGMDIGARTPAEIAIAILAQLVAEHHAPPASAPVPAVGATAPVTDPVCGMEVAATDATPHLDAPGGRVYFCSSGCRDTYAKAGPKQTAGDAGRG